MNVNVGKRNGISNYIFLLIKGKTLIVIIIKTFIEKRRTKEIFGDWRNSLKNVFK